MNELKRVIRLHFKIWGGLLAVALLTLSIVPNRAFAQGQPQLQKCLPTASAMAEQLAAAPHHEELVAGALTPNGLMEIYASVDGDTFTIVETVAGQGTCIKMFGNNWTDLRESRRIGTTYRIVPGARQAWWVP